MFWACPAYRPLSECKACKAPSRASFRACLLSLLLRLGFVTKENKASEGEQNADEVSSASKGERWGMGHWPAIYLEDLALQAPYIALSLQRPKFQSSTDIITPDEANISKQEGTSHQ